MKTNIVFLMWDTKKSGGNMRNFECAERLRKKGYSVRILSICGGKTEGFPFGIKPTPFLKFLRSFWKRKKTDILIATFWPTAYVALLLPAKRRYYFVRNWEACFYSNPLLSFLALMSLKLPFDKVITISGFLKEKIQKVSGKKVCVVPNPVDLTLFRPPDERKEKFNKKVLMVVSRYGLYKGIDNLVKIVRELKKRNPHLFFILVSFEKFPYSDCFDKFVSDPPVGRLVAEYQAADIFLNVSLTEGFCLPPLEAMACGCPVVMTDSGGTREYAVGNKNCLLAKNAEEILKKRMVEKVLNKPFLRRKLIRNGFETAKRFTWEHTIRRLEECLTP